MGTSKDGSSAWRDLVKNPSRWWQYKKTEDSSIQTAASRLRSHMIVVPPTNFNLGLARSSSVYAAGSCFARNIEDELISAGLQVLSKTTSVKLGPESGRRANAFLNRYNSGSLAQEFIQAFDHDAPKCSLMVVRNHEEAIDLSLCSLPYQTIPSVQRLRLETSKSFAQARDADLLILTLGVNEVWRDTTNGSWLNITPPRHIVDSMPGRFQVAELSPEDNYNNIRTAIKLARAARKECMPVVLTVSPVPLEATFFGECVISQTFKGKSILRTAAALACERITNVHYFPSYEAAMISNSLLTWDSDRRHPTALFVSAITKEFLARQNLIPPSELDEFFNTLSTKDQNEVLILKSYMKRMGLTISNLMCNSTSEQAKRADFLN